MTESTGRCTENNASTDKKEIFNSGLCYYGETIEDNSDKDKESKYKCIICGHEVKSKKHPLFIIRACDRPISIEQAEKENDVKIPSMVKRLGNFGIAYLRHIATGNVPADDMLIDERLLICQKDTLWYKDGICMKCGCNVNRLRADEGLNKLAWKDSKCPLNYW